jgi:DNA primase large subunit
VPHEGVDEEQHEHLPTLYLKDLLHRVPFADITQTVYYKVPFEDAIDLLRERKVLLRAGFAYVSRTNLSAIIAARFRANLGLHLAQTCRATAQMRQDVRVTPLVNMLSKAYINPSYKASKIEGAVTKEQLPALAARSMPLCMSSLMKTLKQEDHLKHSARMQLGLFLKGIGLSLNDALAFWKQSFARKIPPEKFDKEYAYNIRHNYGKGTPHTYTQQQ